MEKSERDDGCRTHELIQRFLEQTTEFVVIALDAHGKVVDWSGAAQRVLGYTRDEMIGQSIDALFTDGDRSLGIPSYELTLSATGAASADDRWHLCKDGSEIWVFGTVTAVRDDSGEVIGYVKLIRDRTDIKSQMEVHRHRQESLRNEQVGSRKALATFSHELRNPIGAISNAFNLMRAGHVDEKAHQRCEEVIERQLQVVDALPAAHMWIMGDSARLTQVFTNLLDNALKYTPSGGTVWVKATVEGESAVVRFEDTGVGVQPDMLRPVFNFFTREDRSKSLSPTGMGIGLGLVREFVEMHGGTVEARSAGVDKGSEFAVRLPIKGPSH